VGETEYNGGGELVQSTLCVCMELSQRNPLKLSMYANLKIKQEQQNTNNEKPQHALNSRFCWTQLNSLMDLNSFCWLEIGWS
jgi:hypothetical protein